MSVAGSLGSLVLGNVVAGTGLLLSAISAQGIIARRAEAADRDRAFGLFTVAASMGQLVGPLVSGMTAHRVASAAGGDSPRAGLLSAAALAGLLVVVAVAYREQDGGVGHTEKGAAARVSGEGSSGHTAISQMLTTRGMPPAMLASLALLTAVDLITAFLPVLAEERGLTPQTVGWLLALRALASIASRLLVARLAARWGRRLVLVASMAVAAAMLAVLPVVSVLGALIALMLVIGFMLGIGQPLTMSWVIGLVPERSRATALAVRLGANRVGQVLVPVAAGAVAGVAGTGGVFVLTASLLCFGSAGVLVSRPQHEDGG